ncbi:MAG: patatin-like phospholipase family protein [Anaerolineales bacterium]|nr:patatin-like phospholipase family protein [Anaerolineales bacterium]
MEISLALGGGGSRGSAHLGVLRALEGEGFKIKAVAGTSAGGMAASIYAAGYKPQEAIDIFSQVDQNELFSFGNGRALLGVKGIVKAMARFIEEETFQDLIMPCALTAVDIKEMREVVLQEGRVLDAVMATIAIPGVFPPKKWGERFLVDGGVLDPVPVQIARSLAPDLPVVAVVLSPHPEKWKEISAPEIFSETPILKPIKRMRVAQAFDIFTRSVELMTHELSEKQLELEKPDVIIRPDLVDVGILDKVNVIEIAARGDLAVEKALPELEALKKKKKGIRRFFT